MASFQVPNNQTFGDQFALPLGPTWEKRENPQVYDELEVQVVSPTPKRQLLGLVGGNNVSAVYASQINVVNGQQADVESDLRGTTRPLTFCPWRNYQPQAPGQTTITRVNTKGRFSVDAKLYDLSPMQMWAYPATYQPEPMIKESCGRPEKY